MATEERILTRLLFVCSYANEAAPWPRLEKDPIQAASGAAFFSWAINGPSGETLLNKGAIRSSESSLCS